MVWRELQWCNFGWVEGGVGCGLWSSWLRSESFWIGDRSAVLRGKVGRERRFERRNAATSVARIRSEIIDQLEVVDDAGGK